MAYLALSLFGSAAFAQAPPAYPGTTTTFPAYYGNAEPGPSAVWDVEGPGVSGDPSGWNVTYHSVGHTLTITVPATLPASSYGSYTASYVTGHTGSVDNQVFVGYSCSFQVVATPPTLPPAGNPAFSWQGSVAGVNTGNGNKTTTLPITGWTQRGGMGVSCALYHNSQGGLGGTYGYKWNPSYLTYITPGPGSGVTLHWDNGLTYSSVNTSGTLYTLPYGILDTLNSTSSGTFTMKTPSQTVYTFGFAPNGASGNAYLSKITDMDGNTLTINHNADTTLSTVTDSTGRTLTYNYSGGHLTAITDPLGRQWGFSYVSGSYLQDIQLPTVSGQNYTLSFYYGDGRQNITQSTNARRFSSTYTYNSNNSLATATDPLGNTTTFTYNANNTVITDPNGHTTTHTYQSSRLTSTTDALGYSTQTAYDYNNIVTSATDKRGYVWGYLSHFTSGNATSTTDPLNYTTSSTYDADNKVTQSVDAVGNTTASTYTQDSKEDLLTTSVTGTGSAPFKATSKVSSYNAYGQPTTFTDPLGYGSSVGYDGNGYPSSATDANGNKSTAVYNALGWKTSSTDANSHTTTYTYDNWGRVTAVTAPDSTKTTTTYDPNGNMLTVTDADSHTVANVYDGDDRLTQTTNGRGDVVKYAYDGTDPVSGGTQKGLLSSKTDGNSHTTSYSYTARNEPSATYYPDGTHESVSYDKNGNSISRTKADGKVIRYTYDADNRLTDITYPTLPAVHFGYDADGRRTSMTDGISTASNPTFWVYGDGLHLTQQGSGRGNVFYSYDADGRRSAMGAPGVNPSNSQAMYLYGYDPGGRLTSLQNPFSETTQFAYNPDGTLAKKTLATGASITYGYDTAAQMTGLSFAWPGTSYSHRYTYTPGGELASRSESDGGVNTFGYDGADQLVSEVRTGPVPFSDAYTYDHNGNRLTMTVNGNLYQQFSYNQHDVLAAGINETPSWDLNGNMTGDTLNGQHMGYTWDDEDRLTSVTLPDGHTDTFSYNGLGMRLTKSDPTGSYSYFTDGLSPASAVLSDNYSTFTPGISETKGAAGGGYASEFYLADASGNSRGLLNGSGSATDGYNWDAFGNLMSRFGSNPTMFAWNEKSGYQSDSDDGLTLLGHRYYDKRTGRFISQDPAGDGDNWYQYASNNPMNKTDASGLSDGLPGSLGAPDSHYGGAGGLLDGGGMSSLDSFWDSQNDSEQTQTGIEAAAKEAAGPQDYAVNLLDSLAPIASQLDDITASASYGISLSIGPIRFSGGVGVAYDFVTGKIETFYQTGVYAGWGKGLSGGLAFTLGNDTLGNFGGFNGPSLNVDWLTGSHGLFGLEGNLNYLGVEVSPTIIGTPQYNTQWGSENGVYGGVTNTVPFGPTYKLPSLPSVPTLHF